MHASGVVCRLEWMDTRLAGDVYYNIVVVEDSGGPLQFRASGSLMDFRIGSKIEFLLVSLPRPATTWLAIGLRPGGVPSLDWLCTRAIVHA